MNYYIELNPNLDEICFDLKNAKPVDGKSKLLNDNMIVFLKNQFKVNDINFNKCDRNTKREVLGISLDGERLTCDYLGPSQYWQGLSPGVNL